VALLPRRSHGPLSPSSRLGFRSFRLDMCRQPNAFIVSVNRTGIGWRELLRRKRQDGGRRQKQKKRHREILSIASVQPIRRDIPQDDCHARPLSLAAVVIDDDRSSSNLESSHSGILLSTTIHQCRVYAFTMAAWVTWPTNSNHPMDITDWV